MKADEIKSLKEATFVYPESKTNEVKDRDVFVINQDQTDIYSISLHDMSEEDRAELFEAADKLNAIIEKHTKGRFRRFKRETIIKLNG